MFGKIKESSIFHLVVLAFGVGAVFLIMKGGANYLPANGVGGSIKRVIQAV